ncbi:dimethyladenosine transferase 2, mitochondrial [Genypterus blacodes]|uniref:dimethyladenosine transferase 2, mitochondrial n=1 Tax=Genypterus blacodes TaxID=154954 RepID=UPI003F75970B
MTTQVCRMVESVMRSARCQTRRSKHCSHGKAFAPAGLSRLCVHRVPLLQRRTFSLNSQFSGPSRPSFGPISQQPCAERKSPSSALTHRNLSAVTLQGQYRPLCQYDFLDISDVEGNVQRAQACKINRQFIVDPDLATLVTQHMDIDLQDSKTVVFEINPGPGVLTKSLLKAGAQRVVALEGEKTFFLDLQEIEGHLDGQLEAVYCNYFKLDPIGSGKLKPPVMSSDKLFTDLGISESSWTDDVPVKVVGIMPPRNERGFLLKLMYSLFERQSIFRYGRIEHNLFISEKEYLDMVVRPGNMANYRALGVLSQMACDIELLHKEPWNSFVSSSKQSSKPLAKSTLPNNHRCLVRLRPRADLFSGGLTPSSASTLLFMIKQCFAKRRAKLINRLNLWSPDSGSKLLSEMGLPDDILIGNVYPEQYLELFRLIVKSQEFTQSWLYKEILENQGRRGWA